MGEATVHFTIKERPVTASLLTKARECAQPGLENAESKCVASMPKCCSGLLFNDRDFLFILGFNVSIPQSTAPLALGARYHLSA